MLTSWKSTHTTVGLPSSADSSLPVLANGCKNGKAKKNKKHASQGKATTLTTSYISRNPTIAVNFVQPLAKNDPFFQERLKLSGRKRKKRKINADSSALKAGNFGARDLGGDENAIDESNLEPILCLTSSHRVVLIGKVHGKHHISEEENIALVESKSRNYVARPGARSRFSLGCVGENNNIGASSLKKTNGKFNCDGMDRSTANNSFSGVLPTGARYDPVSNLVFALRNSGAEIAVWTAASSSMISGPDDKASKNTFNIHSHIDGQEMASGTTMAQKRKKHQHLSNGSPWVPESVGLQCLQLPPGKRALTLTPFNIPSSSSQHGQISTSIVATGAAGCCEDGSIWSIVLFHSNHQDTKDDVSNNPHSFHLFMADGSKSQAKKDKVSLWRNSKLLDSNAFGVIEQESDKLGESDRETISLLLKVQLVIASEDIGQVILCDHHLRIEDGRNAEQNKSNHERKGCESRQCRLVKVTNQNMLAIVGSSREIAAKFSALSKSLHILHLGKERKWIHTSLSLSRLECGLVDTISSFALPYGRHDNQTQINAFSFGVVGKDTTTVLMKHSPIGKEKLADSNFYLVILDARRKVELLTLSWTERGSDRIKERIDEDENLKPIMQGKICHAMATNELDGSIALVVSSIQGKGNLEIISSRIRTTTNRPHQYSSAPDTSLAATLRTVALSKPRDFEVSKAEFLKKSSTACLTSLISSGNEDKRDPNDQVVIESACNLLTQASKTLIEAHNDTDEMTGKYTENGFKGKKHGCKREYISWEQNYREGCMMIREAHGGGQGSAGNEIMNIKSDVKASLETKNGSKTGYSLISGVTEPAKMPKCFLNTSFKETVHILLSLRKRNKISETKTFSLVERSQREAVSVLINILRTNQVSARSQFGKENIVLSLLQACPSISYKPISAFLIDSQNNEVLGALDVIDAMLYHMKDISEYVLLSMLRFVLRNVQVEDVVAYYSNCHARESGDGNRLFILPKKGFELSIKYKAEINGKNANKLSEHENDKSALSSLGTKIISEAVLDFSSKIVMYSRCNHSFLRRVMKEDLQTSGEVETLLLALAKLLRSGRQHSFSGGTTETRDFKQESLTLGTIHWITALADAHMSTIVRMTLEGSFVAERLFSAVQSACSQVGLANDIKEIIGLITAKSVMGRESILDGTTKLESEVVDSAHARSTDATAPYVIERLII